MGDDSSLFTFKIIPGGRSVISVLLQKSDTTPYDLTGITDIQTCFANADGTELDLSLVGGNIAVIGNMILGKIAVTITSAQSALLAQTGLETLELALIFGSADPIKVQIQNAYQVVSAQC